MVKSYSAWPIYQHMLYLNSTGFGMLQTYNGFDSSLLFRALVVSSLWSPVKKFRTMAKKSSLQNHVHFLELLSLQWLFLNAQLFHVTLDADDRTSLVQSRGEPRDVCSLSVTSALQPRTQYWWGSESRGEPMVVCSLTVTSVLWALDFEFSKPLAMYKCDIVY